MTRYGSNGLWWLSWASGVSAIAIVANSPSPTLAQITPDNTLGAEQSQVTPDVDIRGGLADRIDGGAIRGVNLFHSFGEFNVRELQRVYFANPEGIENILGRVTGSHRSDILGTLGVDGGANLFFVNPNGVVFGPDAQLDIRGTLVVGTADGFTFPDGSEFRAKDPNAPPLVTVNIPIGLQYGSDAPPALVSEADLEVGESLMLSGGSVTSTGHLSAPEGQVVIEGVAGDVQVQDVTAQSAILASSQDLVLEESQLKTTGNMNLLAEQTVRVRDSVENPFLALAGGNLLIQGNESVDILALNHPQTPFQSRGSLTLVSDGNVSGDAHFYSGGNFSILNLAGEPGTFLSLYDPIISVNGDVTFGNYTGAALKVEATGSINVTGDIRITGPDINFQGGNAAAIGNITPIEGGAIVSNESGSVSAAALATFLGTEDLSVLNNGATEGSGFQTTFNATAEQKISFEWNFLTSESTPSTSYNDFAFFSLIGPDDTATATGTIFTGGEETNLIGLNELADTGFSDGIAPDPDFTPSDSGFNEETGIKTFSVTLETPGDYTLSIGVLDVGDASVGSGLQVNNFDLGDNPPIDVTLTDDPDIPILGSSPALILRAGVSPDEINDIPQDGDLSGFAPGDPDLTELPTLPGSIEINGNINTSGDVAGPVILSASGDISVDGNIRASSTAPNSNNNGGSVTITADGTVSLKNGDVINRPTGTGTGGNILIEGQSVELNNFGLDPATFEDGNTGSTTIIATGTPDPTNPNSGTVFLSENIIYGDNFSDDPDSRGGNISITGYSIELDNFTLNTINSGAGIGGSISLEAANAISLIRGSQITSANSDNGSGGNITLEADNQVTITGTLDQPTRIDASTSSSSTDGFGGDITITSNSVEITSNVFIDASTSGAANGGNILVNANNGIVSINEGQISTAVEDPDGPDGVNEAVGKGGDITISGQSVAINNNSSVTAGTDSTGNSGSVSVAANGGTITLQNESEITTSSTGAGNAGNVDVTAPSVVLNNASKITAETATSGIEGLGNISLQELEILEVNNSLISTSTQSGVAGDVLINAEESVILSGTFIPEGGGEPQGGLLATAEEGSAGNLTITTPQLTVQNGAQAAVSSAGTGIAGSLEVNAGIITLTNQAALIADSDASTEGGNVILQGVSEGTIVEQQPLVSLQVFDSLISASTNSGNAGDVSVNTTDSVVLSGTYQDKPAGLLAEARQGGNAGSVTITTDQLLIEDGAAAAVSSEGVKPSNASSGNAGNVTVTANAVTLNSGGQITAETEGGGATAPAIIDLQGLETLQVNNGVISSSTESGVAGDVLVDVSDSVEVNDNGSISSSSTSGEAGNVSIKAPESVTVTDGLISSSTESGKAGSVTVNATDVINLSGTFTDSTGTNSPAGVLAAATEGGNAGGVSLTTNQLTIDNGAAATASSEGVKPSDGTSGNAGNVTIDANGVAVNSGGQITAETEGGGATAPAIIDLQGLETLQVNNGVISSSTESGVAGDVLVDVSDSVEVNDNGSISSSSTSGEAGNVSIKAPESVTVTNGLISSSTESGKAGSVTVNATDVVNLSGTFTDSNGTQTSAGVLAAATEGGDAGGVSLTTEQLTIDNGAAATASSEGVKPSDGTSGNAGNVTIDANGVAVNSGGQITAETEGGGATAPAIIDLQGLETLQVNNGVISSSTESGVAGDVLVDVSDSVEVNDNGSISSSSTSGEAGNVSIKAPESVTVTDGLISSSTESGKAGSVTVNATDVINLSGTFTDSTGTNSPAGVLAAATEGGDAGGVSLTTNQLTIDNGAAATASSEGVKPSDGTSGNAGNVTIDANGVAVNSGGQITAETEGGGATAPANIELQGLETLQVNNGVISSSTQSGVAGNVSADVSESVTVNDNGLIASSSTSGEAGNVSIKAPESVTVTDGLISSSTESGEAGSVTVNATDAVNLSGTFTDSNGTQTSAGVLAAATEGGNAGSLTINTEELTIENGAAAAVSSKEGAGNAGDINITSQEVTLNSGGEIAAETDAGGRDRPSTITLQGLETLEMDGGTISASTNTGGAGNVSVDASDSVELDDNSRIAVIATGENGIAGNLTVNTGDFLVRDNSEVSVSSPEGVAGNLNVNADFIALNRGRITAEAGQGDGGANINLNVKGFLDLNSGGLSGFLRLDNESLISALATGNATGGNIDISAQFVIASFPTGAQGSDIVADAVFGNGGQINISALGIFGIQFRPERTPLNDITANSQSGSSGTVQLVTLGIDPSRGLAALPLNFVDVSGLVGGQCSVGSGAELGRFTIIGRGGLPLNPTDPLTPEADRADWVSLDPETDELSLNPEATTQIHLTPFNTSVTSRQLAEFPALCYQSLSSPTVTPE